MLKRATNAQANTFEELQRVFTSAGIKFMLIGGAACREHGLRRPTEDLDIVLDPYKEGLRSLAGSNRFGERLGNFPDWTKRTTTYFDSKTDVIIDFLTAGIRISDGKSTNSRIRDPLPIPSPATEIAAPEVLVGMKISAVISGETLRLYGIKDNRPQSKMETDLKDVLELIGLCGLERDISLGHPVVESRYRELWDSHFQALTPRR